MKVKLAKLSICTCGFPVLAEHIKLGTEYEVDPQNEESLTMICGGCKKHINCNCVMVEGRNGGRAGYLPKDIFAI